MVIGIKEFYNNVRNEARDFFYLLKYALTLFSLILNGFSHLFNRIKKIANTHNITPNV